MIMTPFEYLKSLGAPKFYLTWISTFDTLQGAWDACDHAEWMAWYLGRLGEMDVKGDPLHRLAVKVSCMCSRVSVSCAEEWSKEVDILLGQVEAWASGENVDLTDAHRRLYNIRSEAFSKAGKVNNLRLGNDTNSIAAYCAISSAFSAVRCAWTTAISSSALLAAFDAADAYSVDNLPSTHLGLLADMIRNEVPIVPIGSNS